MYLKILLLLVISTLPLLSQSDWEPIDIGSTKIVDLHSFGEDTIFAAVQNVEIHELYRSTDKGINWEMIYQSKGLDEDSEVGALINIERYVTFDSKYHYLTMWEHELIRISNDSGKTFRNVYFNTDVFDNSFITQLAMYDSLRGLAISSNQRIYTTTDGWESCDTITRDYQYGYKATLYFINKNEVNLLRHDGILEIFNFESGKFEIISNEGGDNEDIWQIHEYCIINENLIFGAASDGNGIGNQRIDIIFKSIDGGKNWEKIYHKENEPIFGLNSIDFYDRYNGVAVGYRKILLTNDGGRSWDLDVLPPNMRATERITSIEWVGKTPIIGTFGGGMFRYEGDYFDFDQVEPEEFYFSVNGDTKYCFDTESTELQIIEPAGGIYSGDGIKDNFLTPSEVGSGEHEITYSYTSEDELFKDTTFSIEIYKRLTSPVIEQNLDTLTTQYGKVEWYSTSNRDSIIDYSNYITPQKEGGYLAKYKDENECLSEFSEDFYFEITSVNNDNDKNRPIIVNNTLYIPEFILQKTNSLKLYTLEGKLISNLTPKSEINLDLINRGLYFIAIETTNRQYIVKYIR